MDSAFLNDNDDDNLSITDDDEFEKDGTYHQIHRRNEHVQRYQNERNNADEFFERKNEGNIYEDIKCLLQKHEQRHRLQQHQNQEHFENVVINVLKEQQKQNERYEQFVSKVLKEQQQINQLQLNALKEERKQNEQRFEQFVSKVLKEQQRINQLQLNALKEQQKQDERRFEQFVFQVLKQIEQSREGWGKTCDKQFQMDNGKNAE